MQNAKFKINFKWLDLLKKKIKNAFSKERQRLQKNSLPEIFILNPMDYTHKTSGQTSKVDILLKKKNYLNYIMKNLDSGENEEFS